MDLQKQLDSLKKEIDEITKLLEDVNARTTGSATYKGRRRTLTELVELREKVRTERSKIAVQKQEADEEASRKKVAEGYERINLERDFKNAKSMLDAAIDVGGNIEQAQADYVAATNALRELDPQNKLLPKGVVSQPAATQRTTTTQPVSPSLAPAGAPNARVAQEIAKGATEPTVIKSEPKIINGERVIVDLYSDKSEKVRKDLSSPGAEPVFNTGGVTGKAAKGKAPKTRVINWEPTFRDTFPAKAWLLDLDRDKYPGLFNLLQKAVTENYTNERFAAEIDGTDFYRELAQSGKVREIKAIVGDLGFDSTDFTKFVSDSINFGWQGDTLKQKTYEEVFRRNADGTYANPTALARAKKSNDFLNVQLVATNYFNKASDASIESVLTGRIMLEDFQRQQREIAKSKYSHLASLIDQGVTLEDLSANFRQSAARLLEVDPATIDMGQADYEVALNFGEADKRRVMTTGEWERLLRTDSRYGWEKTENAKQEARSLASNIAQAFGRII
jgi:hypothetical protein